MSEADVREDVLVPLIAALGYKTGSSFDIRRELSLRYPRQSLGRKQEAKDPVLRGRADYMMRVDGEFSWVLEAKSPVSEIQPAEVEQAWTYAAHPEVRASYFALCNGRNFVVYDSLAGPEAPAILTLAYEELDSRFVDLQEILGPQAIQRQIATRKIARGRPLALGIGSVAQVASGLIKYYETGAPGKINQHVQTIVLGGAAERDDSGRVVVHLDTQAPIPGMQAINDRIGFTGVDLYSDAESFPSPDADPAIFKGTTVFTLPAGEQLPLPGTGQKYTLPNDISCSMTIEAAGVFDAGYFSGSWQGELRASAPLARSVPMSGEFRVRLT